MAVPVSGLSSMALVQVDGSPLAVTTLQWAYRLEMLKEVAGLV